MPEGVKKRLAEEIKLLEHELTTELPAEIKKAVALGEAPTLAAAAEAFQRSVPWPLELRGVASLTDPTIRELRTLRSFDPERHFLGRDLDPVRPPGS